MTLPHDDGLRLELARLDAARATMTEADRFGTTLAGVLSTRGQPLTDDDLTTVMAYAEHVVSDPSSTEEGRARILANTTMESIKKHMQSNPEGGSK